MAPQSIEPLRAVRARHVSCGHDFSSVLTERNDLYTWGSGDSGRLGIGSAQTLFIPMCVPLLSQKRVLQVSLGSDHAGVAPGTLRPSPPPLFPSSPLSLFI